ncbi:AraC family transcriptional regulator [Atopomonas sediminilitoris]|uniref:AraC family transcriptional regulator n=1 Tax=Atopomonas sediminilitoris TaxID=2919919 RepID=UPI001F4ED14F|nr:AraC family transcriptional regulator [Atopomonas sediminilitoris]MCJ8170039.1 AraC family transcriptional regulator [Atopomonas sediminilitoris]
MPEATVPLHFVRAALRGAERRGVDSHSLLQRAGIRPALLNDERSRIAPKPYTRLIQLLWEVLDDEYMGFGQSLSKRGTFGMMCLTIIHCRTLERALLRGSRFYALFPEAPRISLRLEGELAYLSYEDTGHFDPDHFLCESLLVIWHRLGSWLIGQRIPLQAAHFAYPKPAHGDEYRLLFPCPTHFDQTHTSLVFHRRYLDMPLLQDERTLKEFLKHSPADLLSRPDDGSSLHGKLRRLLGRDCRHWPDLEQAAEQLHMSPQTLRRHLREEGASFQELKDQLRRDLAIYLLERAELSLQDISAQLGFSEPSAFHRAFKKWTGQTPGTYRDSEH